MLHVWVDQDLCTGDGLCTDHCPELFVLLEDGISYVIGPEDGRLATIQAARSRRCRFPMRCSTR